MARNTFTLRSLGAVVAGLIAIIVLSTAVDIVLHETGFYPPWGDPMNHVHAAVATAYRIVISIFGCWFAARLAPARPQQHAIVLGIIGVILSLAGAVATWNSGLGPQWYALGLAVVSLPCAWIGGRLRVAQQSHVDFAAARSMS